MPRRGERHRISVVNRIRLEEKLRHPGTPLALRTTRNPQAEGNLRVGAVRSFRPRFGFRRGLRIRFGSDHEDRNALPAIAAERACAHLKRDVPHTDLVIIGDTPRDIECGRAVGARVVAVATGYFSADELADADVVLESLEAFEAEALDVLRAA